VCVCVCVCVTQWLKTRRFLDIKLEAQIGEEVFMFAIRQLAGVHKFVIR